jgi:hypothetical protein
MMAGAEKTMKRNPGLRRAGIAAAVFLLVLGLAGCGGTAGGAEPYTFRFKVKNDHSRSPALEIAKVEFFNGTHDRAPVLRQILALNLGQGQLSDEYRVPGFTGEYGPDERYCGVRVTYSDGAEIFAYEHFGDGSKILVTVSDTIWNNKQIRLARGTW